MSRSQELESLWEQLSARPDAAPSHLDGFASNVQDEINACDQLTMRDAVLVDRLAVEGELKRLRELLRRVEAEAARRRGTSRVE